jgi:hypothetical protein
VLGVAVVGVVSVGFVVGVCVGAFVGVVLGVVGAVVGGAVVVVGVVVGVWVVVMSGVPLVVLRCMATGCRHVGEGLG